MKKIVMMLVLTSILSGCSLEKVVPDVKKDEPVVVEKVIEFEPRNVEASYINVESEKLNIRVDADTESEKVGSVVRNDKLQVISEKLDAQKRIWYEVQTKDGIKGYVAGWFCAKTNITVYVEAEKATIVDVAVEPIPKYIDNPFDETKVAVGDQIVGLVIKEINQVSDLTKITFDGEVKLTGNYYHETSKLSTGKVVRFVPDEASSVFLPRYTKDIDSVWFILSNYDSVASKFGEIGSSGVATITIKNYTISFGTKDAVNQSELVSVVIE